PLGLRGDGVEHQRALAGPGDTGEHGQPAFGDLDVDVLEVVLPGAEHPDEVVAVGGVAVSRHRRLSALTGCTAFSVPSDTRARNVLRSNLPLGSVGIWSARATTQRVGTL